MKTLLYYKRTLVFWREERRKAKTAVQIEICAGHINECIEKIDEIMKG